MALNSLTLYETLLLFSFENCIVLSKGVFLQSSSHYLTPEYWKHPCSGLCYLCIQMIKKCLKTDFRPEFGSQNTSLYIKPSEYLTISPVFKFKLPTSLLWDGFGPLNCWLSSVEHCNNDCCVFPVYVVYDMWMNWKQYWFWTELKDPVIQW